MEDLTPNLESVSENEPLSRTAKWSFWAGAWIIVVFTMGFTNLPAAPIFPIGLVTCFLTAEQGITACMLNGFGNFLGFGGWMIYALLSSRMAVARTKFAFFLSYSIFCILLVLNIVGCKKTLETAAGIN